MCNLHPADINGRSPLEHATVWACDADKCCSLNGIYLLHACFSIMRLALSCHPGSREAGWLVLELALLVSAITSLLRRPVGPRREGAYGDRAFGHPVGHLLGFRRTRPLGRSVRGASGRRGGGLDRG